MWMKLMAKSNYSKAEDAFDEAMQKMAIEKLIAQTSKNALTPEDHQSSKKVLLTLANAIKHYSKADKHFYKQLGLKHEEVRKLLSHPNPNADEWQSILVLQEKLKEYKQTALALPQAQDEKVIENERVKHVNKRYNVNDTWLPLH
jgi:hypothetical protein